MTIAKQKPTLCFKMGLNFTPDFVKYLLGSVALLRLKVSPFVLGCNLGASKQASALSKVLWDMRSRVQFCRVLCVQQKNDSILKCFGDLRPTGLAVSTSCLSRIRNETIPVNQVNIPSYQFWVYGNMIFQWLAFKQDANHGPPVGNLPRFSLYTITNEKDVSLRQTWTRIVLWRGRHVNHNANHPIFF